jgi:hypothetical protein
MFDHMVEPHQCDPIDFRMFIQEPGGDMVCHIAEHGKTPHIVGPFGVAVYDLVSHIPVSPMKHIALAICRKRTNKKSMVRSPWRVIPNIKRSGRFVVRSCKIKIPIPYFLFSAT